MIEEQSGLLGRFSTEVAAIKSSETYWIDVTIRVAAIRAVSPTEMG